ncbi:Zinc knuckle [Trichostrongylus colubriformis]|uniref:Zinc knuckle n=1 Tax=Trichostrongylus colubriformis TaxID=6319 RepID=A0AAN8FBU4_TRICO
MSAVGYIKGQMTKAAKALKERISTIEKFLTEGPDIDTKSGEDPTQAQTRQLLDFTVSLNYLMANLNSSWQRGETHAQTIESDSDRYTLLQEFTDYWEANGSEQLLMRGQVLLSTIELIKKKMEDNQAGQEVTERRSRVVASSDGIVQLPKLEIPEFEGDMVTFPEFWEIYKAAIHDNPTLPASVKFLHLKSKLKGRAKALLASIELGAENYPKAIELLYNTYNRPDVLRNRLIEQLEALPPAHDAPIDQRTTLCKIKAIWVQLKSLNEQPGSTTTMRIIRSKFPRRTREKVGELRQRNDNWTADNLIQAFDTVVDQLEVMEDTDPTSFSTSRLCLVSSSRSSTRQSKGQKVRKPSKERGTSHQRSVTGSVSPRTRSRFDQDQRCSFCLRKGHHPSNCEEITSPYSRRKMVVKSKLCWKCLKSGHQKSYCDSPPCYKCGKDHHHSLCYMENRSRSSSRSTSPMSRRYTRRDSLDSQSSELRSRSRYGTKYQSPSPNRREQSPLRKANRRGSPHPKVEFSKTSDVHTYSNPLVTPVTSDFDYNSTDSEPEESDNQREEKSDVNTVQIGEAQVNAISRYKEGASFSNPPRLMTLQALTFNYITRNKQLLVVLLDSGSQHSYIKEDTARHLGLTCKSPRDITAVTFGGHSHTEKSYRVKIILQNNSNNNPTVLHLWTRKFITTVSTDTNEEDEAMTVRYGSRGLKEVDILIGMDYYWNVIDFNSNQQLPSGLKQHGQRFGHFE